MGTTCTDATSARMLSRSSGSRNSVRHSGVPVGTPTACQTATEATSKSPEHRDWQVHDTAAAVTATATAAAVGHHVEWTAKSKRLTPLEAYIYREDSNLMPI